SEDIQDQLVSPFQKFLREDLKDLKEVRKNNDKISEKYESAVAKYASVNKSKDPTSAQEEAFALFEIRRAYFRSSFDYVHQILVFKDKLDTRFSEKVMGAMYAHVDYFQYSAEVFMGLKPAMDTLKG
ncbi:SNF1-interacting protein, partial [Cladochytrium tenue]